MFSRSWLSLAVVLGLASSALAQRGGGGVIQLTGVDIQGKIVQVGRGTIMVTAATGQNWRVNVPNNPRVKIKVTGTAEPDFLGPGMYVRFAATIDKRQSRGTEKVKSVTIFNPSQASADRMPGVRRFNEPAAGDFGADPAFGPPAGRGAGGPAKGRGKPARDPGVLDTPLPLDDVPQTKPGKRPPRTTKKRPGADDGGEAASPPANVDVYEVRAQVVSLKAGRLVVSCQNQYFKPKLTVELAEDVEIAVDSTDYTMAKAGDTAKIRGFSGSPGMAEAQDVEITLTEPLSKPGKRVKRPAGKAGTEVAERGTAKPKVKPKAKRDGTDIDDLIEQAPGKEDAAKPAGKAEEPAAGADKPDQIRKLIELPPNELAGKGTLMVTLDKESLAFTPCKPVPGEQIRKKFGDPDSIGNINADMPDDTGKAKAVSWQLWLYGPLHLFVDDSGKGKLLYYNWSKPPEKEKAKEE